MFDRDREGTERSFLARWSVPFALAAAVLVVVGSGVREYNGALDLEHARFLARAHAHVGAIRDHLGNRETLARGLAAVFEPSDPAVAAALPRADEELFAILPDIASFVWVPRVGPPDAEEALSALRRRGVDAPAFFGQGRAPVRPESAELPLLPVMDIMPRSPTNLTSLGLDLGALPAPRAALADAERRRAPAATAPLQLVQLPGVTAVVLYVPVYQRPSQGAPPVGFLGFSYRLDRLFGTAMEPDSLEGLALRVTDAATGDVLFQHGDAASAAERTTLSVEFGGRTWSAAYAPVGAAQGAALARGTVAAGIAAVFVGGVLGAALYLARARDRLEAALAGRAVAEGALRASEASLRGANDTLRLALTSADAVAFVWNIADGTVSRLYSRDPARPPQGTLEQMLALVHAEDREAFKARLDAVVADPAGHYEAEYRIVTGEGRVRWLRDAGQVERDASGKAVRLVGIAVDVTEAKRAEEARRLLVRELDHRVKNLFAVAAGMVALTARGARDKEELAATLTGRLAALARAHDLVNGAIRTGGAQSGADLRELVATVAAPHADASRLSLEGPRVAVGSASVTSLALVLHELATNAAKYGAFAVAEGRLAVRWREEGERLRVEWKESGGPPVDDAPKDKGFGSRLASQSVAQLGGALAVAWEADGLRVTLDLPREPLAA